MDSSLVHCRVTDNVLATARPNNKVIEDHNIIEQFHK